MVKRGVGEAVEIGGRLPCELRDSARRADYGRNYDRLVDIKTAVDPANRFRPAQGTRPR